MVGVNTRIPQLIRIIISILVCAACTSLNTDPNLNSTLQALKTNPQPTPQFLEDIHYGDQCISVRQNKIWESGNTIRELQDHLYNSIKVVVDGQKTFTKNEVIQQISLVGIHVFDDTGIVIGSTGGPILTCVNEALFASGSHVATLEFTSLSGKPYTYTWIFEVP